MANATYTGKIIGELFTVSESKSMIIMAGSMPEGRQARKKAKRERDN